MLHKQHNHMMDTLSRGNVIKLSSHMRQMITLHLNGNQLVILNYDSSSAIDPFVRNVAIHKTGFGNPSMKDKRCCTPSLIRIY